MYLVYLSVLLLILFLNEFYYFYVNPSVENFDNWTPNYKENVAEVVKVTGYNNGMDVIKNMNLSQTQLDAFFRIYNVSIANTINTYSKEFSLSIDQLIKDNEKCNNGNTGNGYTNAENLFNCNNNLKANNALLAQCITTQKGYLSNIGDCNQLITAEKGAFKLN